MSRYTFELRFSGSRVVDAYGESQLEAEGELEEKLADLPDWIDVTVEDVEVDESVDGVDDA